MTSTTDEEQEKRLHQELLEMIERIRPIFDNVEK
jgi:hypothetical protein